MFKTQTHDTRTVQLRVNNMVTMVLWVCEIQHCKPVWVLENSPRRDCPIQSEVLWVKQSRVKTHFVAFLFVTFIFLFLHILLFRKEKKKKRRQYLVSDHTLSERKLKKKKLSLEQYN